MGLLDELRSAAPDAVISDDSDDLLAYRDIHGEAGMISCIVVPRSYDDVSAVLRHCNDNGLAVVPWGGGTNLAGALTPSRKAVALDIKALDLISDLNKDAMKVTVQAGATPDAVDRYLGRHGFRFHHDPWSRTSATIGGSLALDSAGTLHHGYGRIGDQVVSMVVALADGSVNEVGPEPGSEGLTVGTFIASEGILGVILEATFRVHPVPEAYRTAGFGFRKLEKMLAGLRALEDAGLHPDSFIGGSIPKSIKDLQPAVDRAMMKALGIRCGLFVYYEGDAGPVGERAAAAVKVLARFGKKMPQRYSDEWWPNRHTYFESNPGAVDASKQTHVYDLIIPSDRTMEMVSRVEALAGAAGLSDGLSHTLFTAMDAYTVALYLDKGVMRSKAFRTFEERLNEAALELGSVMRIHGYGSHFDPYIVRRSLGDRLDGIVGLKRRLDPNGILNPGILLPAEVEVDR